MTDDAAPARPQPIPDHASLPYFEASIDGKLLVQTCLHCGTFLRPVKPRCSLCFRDDLAWVEATGRATLYSFTVVHQRLHPGLADEVPYNLALIDLEEGVRMTSRIVGVENSQLRIGMPLEVDFETWGPETRLPVFRPSTPLRSAGTRARVDRATT